MGIEFEGDAPFSLPAARAINNVVEVTLYAALPAQGPAPVPIRVQMTWHVAQTLGRELAAAGLQAELNAGAN